MNDDQTVFILDDDSAVLKSLQALLESHGFNVEGFSSGIEFLDRLDPARGGCLILDVRMPEMGGLEVQERLAKRQSRLPVIIITGHGDLPVAVKAMKAGALDFIEKPFEDGVIVNSIRHALSLNEQTQIEDSSLADLKQRLRRLTGREHQVLALVVMGKTNKEVASKLGISSRTVEIHRARVGAKLKARGLSDLVRFAIRAGIDDDA